MSATVKDSRLGLFNHDFITFSNWATNLIEGAACWVISFSNGRFDSNTRLYSPFSSSRSLSGLTYESGLGLDFTFVVDGHEIKASIYTLCQHSSVFTAMFERQWKESGEKRLELNDVSHEAMDTFIKILHGVDVRNVTPTVAIEMVVIAEKYQVRELKKQSVEFAKASLSKENVIDALIVAHQLEIKDMEEAALTYVISNNFGPNLNELNGFDDISGELSKLINQEYRKECLKLSIAKKKLMVMFCTRPSDVS